MRSWVWLVAAAVGCGESASVAPCGAAIAAFVDADGDGFGGEPIEGVCALSEGEVSEGGDCDDGDPDAHPGAVELCDGIDNDCVGGPDQGLDGARIVYADRDGDGYGVAFPAAFRCGPPGPGWSAELGDCSDEDPARHPDATEVCNGLDDDCDFLTDARDPDVDPSTFRSFYADPDRDGFGNRASRIETCDRPSGYVDNGDDCAGDDPDRHPDAIEICNGLDDDCDRRIDDEDGSLDTSTQIDLFLDADGDGWGSPGVVARSCQDGPNQADNDLDCDDTDSSLNLDDLDLDTFTTCDGDCRDDQAAIRPDAIEVCNGLDDDCDRRVDDEDPSIDPSTQSSFHADQDRDGFGDPALFTLACAPIDGASDNGDDCDDSDPRATVVQPWLGDRDGDGAGDGAPVAVGCHAPDPDLAPGTAGLDCDDDDPTRSPLVPEVCDDRIDQDCDGSDKPCCDPDLEVERDGRCYYLDGSGGVCDPGYELAPQSILSTIAGDFIGLDYKHVRSNNCCIAHADQATELQDWGMANADCNSPGPFLLGPALGGAGCTNANNMDRSQLTLCQSL